MSVSFVGDTPVLLPTVKNQAGVVVDVSGAATKFVYFKKPNGSIIKRTATFTTSGTDGKIQITLATTDLDLEGAYSFYPVLTGVSGFSGRGTALSFQVMGN